jgi:undecaprenyl-diphosphatase
MDFILFERYKHMSEFAYYIKQKDELLFFAFNRKINCALLTLLMRVYTFFGSAVFSALLCAALLCASSIISISVFYHVASCIIIGQIFVHAIKKTFGRPRPCHALSDAIVKKLPPMNSYSFPSGHTCAAFCVAFSLSMFFPEFSVLFYITASLSGVSRIYLGMHYPTDVIIGLITGYVSFLLSNFLICAII